MNSFLSQVTQVLLIAQKLRSRGLFLTTPTFRSIITKHSNHISQEKVEEKRSFLRQDVFREKPCFDRMAFSAVGYVL